MGNVSLDNLVGMVLAQNRGLKKMARDNGHEPTGYSIFDKVGRLLTSRYLYPFELTLIAQLLRKDELVMFVRADDMPDDSYLVDNPEEDQLIAGEKLGQPGLSSLAEIACLILWNRDSTLHVVPRDYGNSPLQSSGIKITARSATLFRRVIAHKDPTAILD